LDKSIHRDRPSKKQISGFGLPPIAVTKNQIREFWEEDQIISILEAPFWPIVACEMALSSYDHMRRCAQPTFGTQGSLNRVPCSTLF